MKQSRILEKIIRLIRLNLALILLLLLGTGVFLENSNIYAQEKTLKADINDNIFVSEIFIEKGFSPKSITIRTIDDEISVIAYSDRAKDILFENEILLDADDEIRPGENEIIPHLGTIVIVKVDAFIHKEIVSIPKKVVEINDATLSKGTNIIENAGRNGLNELTIKTVFKDNVEFKKSVISEEIITQSVDKVVRVGTKPTTVHSCTYWNRVINDVVPREENKEKNSWMKFVMLCESGCDSGKGFEKYFEGSKAFYGLYQFTEYTFKAYGGKNMFDGYDQIEVVSRMYDFKGNPAHHWPACNSAFEREYNK